MDRGTRLSEKSPVDQGDSAVRWVAHEVCRLPDGPATLAYLPGVMRCGPAHLALAGAVRRIDQGPVFVAGPGAAPTALWAARAGVKVISRQDSIAEHLALTYSLDANSQQAAFADVGCSYRDLSPQTCDLAMIHLPRGRDLQIEILHLGVAMLRPGGKLVFVGAANEGVRTALRHVKELCGSAGIVSRKGGYHAGLAYAPTESLALPKVQFTDHDVVLDGHAAVLRSCVGVFSHDRLDGGAAALIDAMEIAPGTRILDLGCGTGLVGLAALRRGADVTATDVSARAVTSTQATLEANGVTVEGSEVRVHLCVGASAVASGTIDTVVANPPFHRGHDVAFDVSQLFVSEAARVLKPAGALYLVANSFLDYRPWLDRHFGSTRIAAETAQFRVWNAYK